jgi:hypothetical protein
VERLKALAAAAVPGWLADCKDGLISPAYQLHPRPPHGFIPGSVDHGENFHPIREGNIVNDMAKALDAGGAHILPYDAIELRHRFEPLKHFGDPT